MAKILKNYSMDSGSGLHGGLSPPPCYYANHTQLMVVCLPPCRFFLLAHIIRTCPPILSCPLLAAIFLSHFIFLSDFLPSVTVCTAFRSCITSCLQVCICWLPCLYVLPAQSACPALLHISTCLSQPPVLPACPLFCLPACRRTCTTCSMPACLPARQRRECHVPSQVAQVEKKFKGLVNDFPTDLGYLKSVNSLGTEY
jgi:hypothetical protein